jgi:type VI protein secretion system component VasK
LSESPEKKVLKQTLVRLKSKTITSLESYGESTKNTFQLINSLLASFEKSTSQLEGEQREAMQTIVFMFEDVRNDVTQLVRRSLDVIDDWRTYTDVLESYSAELDNTLENIFEKAIKDSEEQIQKQKQLTDRKPDYAS